jgi:hypothetical protein
MTVPWRVAKSLLVLRDQIKAAYPGTPNPGFIGDAAHASRDSDHNPWVDDPASSLNVVTAGDWYKDLEAGFSSAGFAEILRLRRDPRIKYVISERRIFRSYGKTVNGKYYAPFTWAPYPGDNPHTGHTHVSVLADKAQYDDTRRWLITVLPRPGDTPAQPPASKDWFDMATPAEIETAVYKGALRAFREYGAALFKDESGTADTIWDETRAHRKAELDKLGEIAAAVKAPE